MELQYPIGKFQWSGSLSRERRTALIEDLAIAPVKLREAVAGLSDVQLDTSYRPGGWTVRQVVHHVPDSHMNSYIRFKLALTEPEPAIKPYLEALWAALPDSKGPIEPSLQIVEGLHGRWTALLRSLSDEEFARRFVHPELGPMALDHALALYAWHGRHHTAHITSLRERLGWTADASHWAD